MSHHGPRRHVGVCGTRYASYTAMYCRYTVPLWTTYWAHIADVAHQWPKVTHGGILWPDIPIDYPYGHRKWGGRLYVYTYILLINCLLLLSVKAHHVGKAEVKSIQWTFIEHSRNIEGTLRDHWGTIEGTFREHWGNIELDYCYYHEGGA
jgi:hypothetical protein